MKTKTIKFLRKTRDLAIVGSLFLCALFALGFLIVPTERIENSIIISGIVYVTLLLWKEAEWCMKTKKEHEKQVKNKKYTRKAS